MTPTITKKSVESLKRKRVRDEIGLPKLASNLSPFRYPGGKGKLSKFLATFLIENELHGCELVEPFCGGAGGTLPLLKAGLISKLVLNDINPAISSFWTFVKTDPELLIRKIEAEPVTLERWHHWRNVYNEAEVGTIDLAFAGFFLNRTNRSGILHAGPIGGQSQSGEYTLDCRFTKSNLIKRIEVLANLSDKIEVSSQDAAKVIECAKKNSFIYADPPYVKEGKGIYAKFSFVTKQHEELAYALKAHSNYWLLSYDDDPLIHTLYSGDDINLVELSYAINKAKLGRELLIASSWLRMPELAKQQDIVQTTTQSSDNLHENSNCNILVGL